MPLAYVNFITGSSDVDPGYGGGIAAGGRPDNSLPIPPMGTLPAPPPGIWPPPTIGNPIVPIGPDNTLPVQPGTIWPSPGRPAHPDQGLPGGGHVSGQPIPGGRPDNTLPGQPARPDNTLPSGKFWVVAGIPGVGWRYVCVDPSLEVGMPLPGGRPPVAGNLPAQPQPPTPGIPTHPTQPIQPTPEPKR